MADFTACKKHIFPFDTEAFGEVQLPNGTGLVSADKSEILKKSFSRGAWVAQPVEHPTLDFGSGHDPRVVLSLEPA